MLGVTIMMGFMWLLCGGLGGLCLVNGARMGNNVSGYFLVVFITFVEVASVRLHMRY